MMIDSVDFSLGLGETMHFDYPNLKPCAPHYDQNGSGRKA